MKIEHITKGIITGIIVVWCLFLVGCSRDYRERSNTQLRDYRQNEVRPGKQKVYTDEYWWNGQWQPMPSMGAPNIDIAVDPGSIHVPAGLK